MSSMKHISHLSWENWVSLSCISSKRTDLSIFKVINNSICIISILISDYVDQSSSEGMKVRQVSFVNEGQTPDHQYPVSAGPVMESFSKWESCFSHLGKLLKLNQLQQVQSHRELYLVHLQQGAHGFVPPKRICRMLSSFC